MKLAGIVCEYNPFHLGHAAHIEKTRDILGEDTGIVCAMSGNFVQRGEAAIMSKHARAEAAVLCGADLVLEIPSVWAVASAERFSLGGVAVLSALGLPLTLSFASECGDIDALRRVADAATSENVAERTRDIMKAGIGYAAARQIAVRAAIGADAELLKKPNNILGVEYLKAIKTLGADNITALTFPRIMTEHDGDENGGFAPASYLREKAAQGEDISAYLPAASAEILRRETDAGRAPVSTSALEPAMLYRLRTMSLEEFSLLPDATEGLGARLMDFGRTARSYDEFISLVKTKRYTVSRIRRMALAALLGITGEMQRGKPEYIRVLAANTRGCEILHDVKKTASLPVITKPAGARLLAQNARAAFELEAKIGDIYALAFPSRDARAGGQEWKMTPYIQ